MTSREKHPDPLLQRFIELHVLERRIDDAGHGAQSPNVKMFLVEEQSFGLLADVGERLRLMRQDLDQKLKRLGEAFGVAIAGEKAASGNGPDLVRHAMDQAKLDNLNVKRTRQALRGSYRIDAHLERAAPLGGRWQLTRFLFPQKPPAALSSSSYSTSRRGADLGRGPPPTPHGWISLSCGMSTVGAALDAYLSRPRLLALRKSPTSKLSASRGVPFRSGLRWDFDRRSTLGASCPTR